MRRLARQAAIVAWLVVASGWSAARAGDGAALNVLGFSADGRYFAFEQYGEQDGSGSLYSSIAAIEVASDRLVKGMPVTEVLNPEEANRASEPRDKLLAEVRAKAAAQAAPLINPLGISSPGRLVASLPKSRARDLLNSKQVKAVKAAATGTLTLPADAFGPGVQLVLREFDIALPRCKDLVPEGYPNGFGLTLERKSRPTIHLSRDQTIPVSRGCPDRYGIAEVHALRQPDGSSALAVLVQYFYFSFEGPDRRFLAVTGRLQ